MRKTLEYFLEGFGVLCVVVGIVFGYGMLNQKVEALEKKTTSLDTIEDNIVKIKEDVSFIKGKLSK